MLRLNITFIFFFLIGGLFAFHLFQELPDGNLRVHMLDVGQGDSLLIQTPERQFIMIDAGEGTTILSELSRVLGFFDRRIELLIVSHLDRDHVEGFLSVIERYEIGGVLMSGAFHNSQLERLFFRKLEARGVPVYFAESGRDIRIGNEIFLDILYPFHSLAGVRVQNLNEASVVFRLVQRQRDAVHGLLFSGGDIGFSAEHALLKSGLDLRADLLKVSHHGSKFSTDELFLEAVQPNITAISAGKGNRYGHPHADLLDRLGDLPIRRTDLEGALEFVATRAES